MTKHQQSSVIQEIPGTAEGRPKINIMGAANYGKFKFLLPELSQMNFFTRTTYF
jgi:hypothetical protein